MVPAWRVPDGEPEERPGGEVSGAEYRTPFCLNWETFRFVARSLAYTLNWYVPLARPVMFL